MNNNDLESKLLDITREFLKQLEASRALQGISINVSLEKDLGIDSLGKVELFQRIEKKFNIRFTETAMAQADTLHDLMTFIQKDNQHANIELPTKKITPLASTNLNLDSITTLVDMIHLYGAKETQRPHMYFQNEQGEEIIIHYGDMYTEAKKVAEGLQQRGIQPGETIAIMLPTCPEFFYAFCGTLLAGAIPVPIYPPFRPENIEEYAMREAKILHNAQVRILITFSQAKTLSHILRTFIPSLKEVTTIQNLQSQTTNLLTLPIEPTDGVLIQYTSGSTGDPKGVYLTHQNMLANIRAIGAAAPIHPTDVSVSWLPLYHDMGLMTWLASFYFGLPVTIMSPLSFLTRPEKWLWAIHYHRATMSGGPNFAYELCAKKIDPKTIEGLDLSSWRFAFNGAEAINPKTLEHFSKVFARYGFKPEMFAPVYGLAESTVALTFPKHVRPPRIDKIQRTAFETERKAIPITHQNDKETLEFVACGEPIPQHHIRIVDDESSVVGERIIGNLQFNGPSSMQGYFNNPTATQKIFHDGWWDSGDLAYIADKEVFIIGRKKDVIIKAGRNLYPEEIEQVVNQIANIRKGCVIAFGVADPASGTEKLVIVAEVTDLDQQKQQQTRAKIIEQLTLSLGIPPDIIVLAPTKTIPKTSSGKLQRSTCKDLYLKGKLTQQKLSAKLQIAKLALISIKKTMFKWIGYFFKTLYAIYAVLLLCILCIFLIVGILPAPQTWAIKIAKCLARNFLRLAGCPLKVIGKEHLSETKPLIYTANHASYIDAMILIGILPAGAVFTVKKELNKNLLFKALVKKLGYISIDRQDFGKSLMNKSSIIDALKMKKSIAIFPEATFTYATGLRLFKLGAFTIAVETQTPICPIAIKGARSILRGDNLLPKPGKLEVTVGKAIYPTGDNWDAVLKLHNETRAFIAKYCGEPVIDMIAAGPIVKA